MPDPGPELSLAMTGWISLVESICSSWAVTNPAMGEGELVEVFVEAFESIVVPRVPSRQGKGTVR